MVELKRGNLFESEAQTWVNAVNCVGTMGKGIALAFKKRFPDMFDDYVVRCRRGEVKIGEPYLYKNKTLPWILNFPTKGDWRLPSKLEYVGQGLVYLVDHYQELGITSLAVPALGCGAGGLEWAVVKPVLLEHLGKMTIPVELYVPME